jgi:hypothetical protein
MQAAAPCMPPCMALTVTVTPQHLAHLPGAPSAAPLRPLAPSHLKIRCVPTGCLHDGGGKGREGAIHQSGAAGHLNTAAAPPPCGPPGAPVCFP